MTKSDVIGVKTPLCRASANVLRPRSDFIGSGEDLGQAEPYA